MKTTHTFTREEIYQAAEAFLEHWDWSIEPDADIMQNTLADILVCDDCIGEVSPVEFTGWPNHDDALIEFLDNYARHGEMSWV